MNYLVERILAEPGELTIVCTAPLTNLALALQREPRIVDSMREIVLMGGAATVPGNVKNSVTAEFNVYADPVAAEAVFAQPWPIVMVGLDVTMQVVFSREHRQSLANNTSREATLLKEVTRYLFDMREENEMALHDPLALLVAVEPDLVSTIHADVRVETEGKYTLGQTIVDRRTSAPEPKLHTRVCTDVDARRALSMFFTTLGV